MAKLKTELLPWCQSEEMKILINNNSFIHFIEWGSNPQTSRYSHTLVTLRADDVFDMIVEITIEYIVSRLLSIVTIQGQLLCK